MTRSIQAFFIMLTLALAMSCNAEIKGTEDEPVIPDPGKEQENTPVPRYGAEALDSLMAASGKGKWITAALTIDNGDICGCAITLNTGELLVILYKVKAEDSHSIELYGRLPDYPRPSYDLADAQILDDDPFEHMLLDKDCSEMAIILKDGRSAVIPVKFEFTLLCSCKAAEGGEDQVWLEYYVDGADEEDELVVSVISPDKNLLIGDFEPSARSGEILLTARRDINQTQVALHVTNISTGRVTAKTHRISLAADPEKWDDILSVGKINRSGEIIDGRGSRNGRPWKIVSGEDFSYGHQKNVIDAGTGDWRYRYTLARAIDGDINTEWISRWESGYDLAFPIDIDIDLGASIAPGTIYITDFITHKLAWRNYEVYLAAEYSAGEKGWTKIAGGENLTYMTSPDIDGYDRTYEMVCDKAAYGRYLRLRVTGCDPERCGGNGKAAKIAEIRLKGIYEHPSADPGAPSYIWEKGQGTLPEIADMALCYGGSSHRGPFRWSKERFAPHVSYIDAEGNESWLYESFLAIEFVDVENWMTYQVEPNHKSADKNSWTQLLDYWFEPGYGFDALEEAVEDVRWRIGNPKTRRLVIMTIPDPIIYRNLSDKSEGTVYWGSLDGRELDFSKGEDRRAALEWYIDEVNRRFDAKRYRNIELIGFYIISEDMSRDEWAAPNRRYDQIYPATADYIHSKGEGLYWIPYYRAPGFNLWKEYGIDLAIMQPNYFWNADSRFPTFFSLISTYGMGMELEFDDLLLGPGAQAEEYRQRLRTYMNNARSQGVYGTKAFATYAGGDTFCNLYNSSKDCDRQIFDEYCLFLINNPIKKY